MDPISIPVFKLERVIFLFEMCYVNNIYASILNVSWGFLVICLIVSDMFIKLLLEVPETLQV